MRAKPGFEPDSYEPQRKYDDSPSCLWMLILTVGGYFVFSAINRVGSGYGSTLDKFICYGLLICVGILFALNPYFEKQEKKKLQKTRQEWKRTCKSTEVAIVSRHYSPGGSYEDEYGIPHSSRPSYHLDLEMNADQRAVVPQLLTKVTVYVHQSVYAQLQNRNTVRIYYKLEAPMTFLLEEEF